MAEKFQIDTLDKKILRLISTDARIPFLQIARECKVSGAAIHQRIKRLERIGVISGSGYRFNSRKLGLHTCAYMGIFLDHANLFKQVVKELEDIPEITQCHYTTGIYSIFIKIYARDNEHLKTILADKLQNVKGIARTETFISLEESFNRELPIE